MTMTGVTRLTCLSWSRLVGFHRAGLVSVRILKVKIIYFFFKMVDGWTVLMMKTEVQMQKTPVVNWWCLVRYPNPNWLSSQLENLTRWCLTWNKYHSHSPEWCHLSSRRQPHTWKASFCNEIHPHRQVGKRQIQQNSTYCPGLDLQCPGCGSLEGPDIFVITNME